MANGTFAPDAFTDSLPLLLAFAAIALLAVAGAPWRGIRRVDNPIGVAAVGDPEQGTAGQVVINTLSVELLAVVDETVQPTTAAIWLRPTTRRA